MALAKRPPPNSRISASRSPDRRSDKRPDRQVQTSAGLGLRSCHYNDFLEAKPASLNWVEVVSENYMPWLSHAPVGPMAQLEKIRENVDVALHGVSLSIASTDPLDERYLSTLKELIKRVEPILVSDHLCWTSIKGSHLYDLLPFPYTDESLSLIVDRIGRVQDFLGRQILLENVSSYLEFSSNVMSENDFLTEVAERADCKILLDVNNVYVNSVNHQFDPVQYIRSLPKNRIGQIHLAGHFRQEEPDDPFRVLLVDTHDGPVCEDVWQLFRMAVEQFGHVPSMIEWDADFPTWDGLLAEVAKISEIQREVEGVRSQFTAASDPL